MDTRASLPTQEKYRGQAITTYQGPTHQNTVTKTRLAPMIKATLLPRSTTPEAATTLPKSIFIVALTSRAPVKIGSYRKEYPPTHTTVVKPVESSPYHNSGDTYITYGKPYQNG